ncbi:hypothetical protein AX777_17395 [Sphingobium yanoikuyae]|jgi:hypothetical protein|uniref:Putative DNA-binding domain-containing protein n=1 Tax=Sphingobium yanoikuyae TaxID=13690 RepID=A0A177JWU0_SPHYA|nr:DNA-binding domain-containing protein [Sphingobium yanoikuyae]OAH45384.1 hypothetical protein AX777_17395 [Sphingobium yanoikuyae]
MTGESLARFQARFARDLIDVDLPSPHPLGAGYAIHARNVRNSIVAALEQSFPITGHLVGPSFFERVAREFATVQPPRLGWISAYGADFADFLDNHEGAASVPYLADIARIEWARVRATFADEEAGLDLAALASIPPSALIERRVALHRSATLIRSDHPIYLIWIWHQNPSGEDRIAEADFKRGGDDILVARTVDGQAAVIRLPPADAAFVAALASGQPLGTAWASALDADEHFDLAAALAELVREGALAGLAD